MEGLLYGKFELHDSKIDKRLNHNVKGDLDSTVFEYIQMWNEKEIAFGRQSDIVLKSSRGWLWELGKRGMLLKTYRMSLENVLKYIRLHR